MTERSPSAGRRIFRESAAAAYRRRTEAVVLPRLVSRPIIVCLWLLLAALATAVVIAWSVRVPTYVGASGAVLGRAVGPQAGDVSAAAVVFVAPDAARLRVGRPVHLQVGASDRYLEGEIAKVERGVIGPDAARARYRLAESDLVSRPSVAVLVRLRQALPSVTYGGSVVTARIEAGSRRLLALFAGLGGLAGDGS
jgi:hypothetical protein